MAARITSSRPSSLATRSWFLAGLLVLGLLGWSPAQVPPPPPPPGEGPGFDPDLPPDPVGLEEPAPTGRREMPVQVVGGRLVTRCEVSTVHRRIPVNLFVDFENPCGLQLHNSAAGPLKTEDEAGQTIPVTIHFPGFEVRVEMREQGPEEEYAEFTRLWSREMGEDALVGTIGAHILRDYRVILDLGREVIELHEPRTGEDTPPGEGPPPGELPPDEADPQAAEAEGRETVSITTTDSIVWLPVQIPGGKVTAMALGTSVFDSQIDAGWADDLGFPAGDVSPLRLGELDLSRRVAFRPAEIPYVHPDGALGTIGLNLLLQLRLEIDREAGVAHVEARRDFEPPREDLEFFRAWITEDADELELCLARHPRSRLARETARKLLYLRLDEDGTHDELERAIRYLRQTWREDIITTRSLDLLAEMRAAGRPRLAVFAGSLGIEHGRRDRYPDAVHRVHARMGEILLEAGEDRQAWRHLLSAAFGMPENGKVNLHLGEFYEKQGRLQRALSRYVQAVLSADSGEQAVAGLERVQKKLGSSERLSVEKIESLIAGKVYGYTAATRHRPDENEGNRTVLLEFFTNAHIKHPQRDEGAIGGALGNEGMLSHFPPTSLAAISFHLPHPRLEMDSLTNEVSRHHADLYGVGPTVQVVDGQASFAGMGKAREAETIYKRGRQIVRAALRRPSAYSINLEASLEDGVIRGQLVARGPESETADLHVILVEKAVLYPGKSKVVIHRRVARAALTPTVAGLPFPRDDDRLELDFEHRLEDIERRNLEYLKSLEAAGEGSVRAYATRMDPRQLQIVAFLRDRESREVLQARQFEFTRPAP